MRRSLPTDMITRLNQSRDIYIYRRRRLVIVSAGIIILLILTPLLLIPMVLVRAWLIYYKLRECLAASFTAGMGQRHLILINIKIFVRNFIGLLPRSLRRGYTT